MLRLSQIELNTVLVVRPVVLVALDLAEGGTERRQVCVHTPTLVDRQSIASNQAYNTPVDDIRDYLSLPTKQQLLDILPTPVLASFWPFNRQVGLQVDSSNVKGCNQHSQVLPQFSLDPPKTLQPGVVTWFSSIQILVQATSSARSG